MKVSVGDIVYDQILSVDFSQNPVSGATFNLSLYKNASIYTSVVPSISLTDASTGVFTSFWTPTEIGTYQLFVKNNLTGVIFLGDPVNVVDTTSTLGNVYVGL